LDHHWVRLGRADEFAHLNWPTSLI
jgi:hypothetical protein